MSEDDPFPLIKEESTLFLADAQLYSALNDLIIFVDKELIILSPWIELTGHQEEDLKRAIKDNVNITLLTRQPNPSNAKHGEAVRKLQLFGVQVFFDNILHAKMILMDRSTVLIASSNIIPTSMTRNHEIGVLSTDPDLVLEAFAYVYDLEDILAAPILFRSEKRFLEEKKGIKKILSKLVKRKQIEIEKHNRIFFETCPECGKSLNEKEGINGKFWACLGFPECGYTRNILWKAN